MLNVHNKKISFWCPTKSDDLVNPRQTCVHLLDLISISIKNVPFLQNQNIMNFSNENVKITISKRESAILHDNMHIVQGSDPNLCKVQKGCYDPLSLMLTYF